MWNYEVVWRADLLGKSTVRDHVEFRLRSVQFGLSPDVVPTTMESVLAMDNRQ